MKHVFQDTREMNADIYLDGDNGMDPTAFADRADFIANGVGQMDDGSTVYMLYVGEGYCPLRVAVIAQNSDEALEAAHEWLSENRPDEVADEDYRVHTEAVPSMVLIDLRPKPEPEPSVIYHTVPSLVGAVVFGKYSNYAYKMTGMARKREDSPFMDVEVYPFDLRPLYRFYVPAYSIHRWR